MGLGNWLVYGRYNLPEIRLSKRVRSILEPVGNWSMSAMQIPYIRVRNNSNFRFGDSVCFFFTVFTAEGVALHREAADLVALEPGQSELLSLPFGGLEGVIQRAAYVVLDVEIDWFVRRGDNTRGPFSSERLEKMVALGKLEPSDEVRQKESKEWSKASELRWLFPKKAAPKKEPKPPAARPATPAEYERSDGEAEADKAPSRTKRRPAASSDSPVEKAKAFYNKNPKKALLIGGGILLSVMLMGMCMCAGLFSLVKTANQEAKKDLSDPKSKKNAERKLEAFRTLVAHIKKIPSPLDGAKANDQWLKKAEQLQQEFKDIPFDPAANRTEAKEIIRTYDKEVAGKYSGSFFFALDADIQNDIGHPLITSE